MNFVLYSISILISFYILYKIGKYLKLNLFGPWKNAPPGPFSVPWLGSIPAIIWTFRKMNISATSSPVTMFEALTKKYGEIFWIDTGREISVVISSLRGIKDYSSNPNSVNRPFNTELMDIYSDGEALGFGIGVGGPRWKFLRKFSSNAIKECSGGTKGLYDRISQEISYMIQDLRQKRTQDPVWKDAHRYFDIPSLNLTWTLIGGIGFDYDDDLRIRKQFEYLKTFLQEPYIGAIITMPILLAVPHFNKIYRKVKSAMSQFRLVISEMIDEHKSSAKDENSAADNLIDLFLKAQRKDSNNPYLSNKDLIICCQDLFLAGAETSSRTMSTIVFYLAFFPELQKRAQREIEDAITSDRQVTLEDRSNLPFTDAFVMEVRRYSTPFPLTSFRCSDSDTIVDGYHIPANVTVQINLNGLLLSETNWNDPKTFRPERFLDGNGKIITPEAFLPFGYGRRKCIGEDIANLSNFLMTAELLRAFTFRFNNPQERPSPERIGGIIQSISPFELYVKPRL